MRDVRISVSVCRLYSRIVLRSAAVQMGALLRSLGLRGHKWRRGALNLVLYRGHLVFVWRVAQTLQPSTLRLIYHAAPKGRP